MAMALIDRAKNILLTPKTEWPNIAAEAATTQSIFVGYVLILAAIGPIFLVLKSGGAGLTFAVLNYVVNLAIAFVLALIVDALATSFGGEKDFVQSLKLVAYSYTAAWIAGIANLLPFIGMIIGLLAAIYTVYTFFLGAPVLKKCAPEKAVGFTAVVVVCGIVLGVVVGGFMLTAMMGGGVAGMSGFGTIR
jgi:Yip1 domain